MDCESHDVDVRKWMTPAVKRDTNCETTLMPVNDKTKTSLTLHVGVTAGFVTRVVVGIPSLRLDYYVSGDCQLGVSDTVFGLIPISSLRVAQRKVNCILDASHLKELRDQLSLREFEKRGFTSLPHVVVDPPTSTISLPTPPSNDQTNLLTMFINQSLVYRMKGYNPTKRSSSKAFSFQSEYRTLSVLFVKVMNQASPLEVQGLMTVLLRALKKFHGVFQQCSVDDKGLTLLSCFGLPPFGHEKCGLLAVQAATSFLNRLEEGLAVRLSVVVATGDVLFGTLGTERRREAGLLAARLLYVERERRCIAVDFRTMETVRDEFVCTSLGTFLIKGKSDETEVWGVLPPNTMSKKDLFRKPMSRREMVGNFREMELLRGGVEGWLGGGVERFVVKVEGYRTWGCNYIMY
ncbi:hypothetical protein HDU67_007081 [Dinochytrium kinnereticum]|nr:hypothetical protein HDU67_007081 [Dinochytrium kinnereticum]